MNVSRRSGVVSSLRILFTFAFTFLLLAISHRISARVLDDFDDNAKTGWEDFTFIPGYGLPTESDGQFKFEMTPSPISKPIFSASRKTSEVIELKNGRTIEMKVDVIEGGAKDSFAVLAFIPQSSSPGSLGGYGLAKSTTDILITKGIGKYFVADAGPAAHLKNNNITLVLKLSALDGSVTINAKALDKDADNAVIWERTVVDSPDADVLAAGKDEPKLPYITKGYFTLYLYQDFDPAAPENPYKIYYDNAQVDIKDAPVTTILDDFEDGVKTGWTDFTFIPNYGLPVESDGQFKFNMSPSPINKPLFSASQKTSRVFELKEGETNEFRVDVIEGGLKDSFAVLAFIPQSTGPGSLGGYGLAKSTTDILITKGIGKYFVADAGPAAHLKNDNVTLVLSLAVQNGSVIIHAMALDKDADNAVLWERTVTDSPDTDILAAGKDEPKEPYITKGYFTLYLYQDFDKAAPENPYKIFYDNAISIAPPLPDSVAPLITDVAPGEFANFLPSSTEVSFKVTDDKDVPNSGISVSLNGTAYNTANGLTLSAAGTTRTATLANKLAVNVNYTAVIKATDSEGNLTTRTFYFDTFAPDNLVVEVEDYNYDAGNFINGPVVIAEGSGPQDGSYSHQTGTKEVDYHDTRSTPRSQDAPYRPQDTDRMARTLDAARAKFSDAGGSESQIYDYDVGDIATGEWMNYTREFPSGAYEVYLREALANIPSGDSVLEQVISDSGSEDQTTKILGAFLGVRSGFQYRNYALTDGSGRTKVRLNLQGATTLRLRQITADPGDGSRLMNYMVFVRVGDVEFQRAQIASISPTPDTTIETLAPSILVELQNKDTSVNPASIRLEVNGQVVTPTITSTAQGATVSYALSALPTSGAVNTAKVSFKDSQGTEISSTWNFTISYLTLNPANRAAGSPGTPGMRVHVVQAPSGSNLANTLVRAEEQIKDGSSIERAVDVNDITQVINYDKKTEANPRNYFTENALVPGIDPAVSGAGLDDFTLEATTYLQLAPGIYRFGVVSDDGYKVSSGKSVTDINAAIAGHSGGPANEIVEFVVTQPGLYPFRFLWYERGGDGYAEWFSVNRTTGERTLINDPNTPDSIKAFMDINSVTVTGSSVLGGNFTSADQITVDVAAKKVTVPVSRTAKQLFYKIEVPANWKIKSVEIIIDTLVVTYQ